MVGPGLRLGCDVPIDASPNLKWQSNGLSICFTFCFFGNTPNMANSGDWDFLL